MGKVLGEGSLNQIWAFGRSLPHKFTQLMSGNQNNNSFQSPDPTLMFLLAYRVISLETILGGSGHSGMMCPSPAGFCHTTRLSAPPPPHLMLCMSLMPFFKKAWYISKATVFYLNFAL